MYAHSGGAFVLLNNIPPPTFLRALRLARPARRIRRRPRLPLAPLPPPAHAAPARRRAGGSGVEAARGGSLCTSVREAYYALAEGRKRHLRDFSDVCVGHTFP